VSGTRGNVHALLMRIFESWKSDNFPAYPEGDAFEIFASELTLRTFGVTLDEVQTGIVGGGQDGGIDAVYTFFDDNLLAEDPEVVSNGSKPADFAQGRVLELWMIQSKKSASFEEVALDKLDGTIRRVLDLTQDMNALAAQRHLFEWNVRDFEGKVSVNKEIGQSLQSDSGPEFWWLNNGVTMICSSATTNNKTYSLSDIQIVNGLQTSHTIYDVLQHEKDHPSLDRTLLVRIIVTNDIATRDQIIRATNRQTNVTDASLRATDVVQRNIESYFLTKGWYYDRRKNYYKNEGKEASKIVGIPLLGAAVTAMGLSRADKARGKPSSLLKNDEDYKQVFPPRIDLEVYFWAAKTQKRVNDFLYSEIAGATQAEKNNLKFHLSMLAVEAALGAPARKPQQLHSLATAEHEFDDKNLARIFDSLQTWYQTFLHREGNTLETVSKSQRFSDYLLDRATQSRSRRTPSEVTGK
jgi:AIPR protein